MQSTYPPLPLIDYSLTSFQLLTYLHSEKNFWLDSVVDQTFFIEEHSVFVSQLRSRIPKNTPNKWQRFSTSSEP